MKVKEWEPDKLKLSFHLLGGDLAEMVLAVEQQVFGKFVTVMEEVGDHRELKVVLDTGWVDLNRQIVNKPVDRHYEIVKRAVEDGLLVKKPSGEDIGGGWWGLVRQLGKAPRGEPAEHQYWKFHRWSGDYGAFHPLLVYRAQEIKSFLRTEVEQNYWGVSVEVQPECARESGFDRHYRNEDCNKKFYG